VSPSQWLRANRLPSARGYCVRVRPYPPAPINLCLRPTRVRPQSAPGPTRTRLEYAPDACAPAIAIARKVRARSMRPRLESTPGPMRPRLESAPVPTSPRPLARVRAQRVRAFTSGRTWPTARATSARPQSFPACAPCSRVRPQQYINPFAPPHKSLCS
jgi:hypothetical protein